MPTLVEPFAHDTDFFTEVGNGGSNATFTWSQGRLNLVKLAKNWNTAGLVQNEPFVLDAGVRVDLDITFMTNTVGNPQSSDDNSSTLLNFLASGSSLPSTPALDTTTYGFGISGGKAAIQNAWNGAQVFDAVVQGERYLVRHIIEADGKMAVYCIGEDQPGFLGYVKNPDNSYPDFRGYNARCIIQPYFTDSLRLWDFKVHF